jgi:hypothetical protein
MRRMLQLRCDSLHVGGFGRPVHVLPRLAYHLSISADSAAHKMLPWKARAASTQQVVLPMPCQCRVQERATVLVRRCRHDETPFDSACKRYVYLI